MLPFRSSSLGSPFFCFVTLTVSIIQGDRYIILFSQTASLISTLVTRSVPEFDMLILGLMIAGGIALQNIPEGMVIIGPMLAAGIPKGRTFLIAAATGIVEVLGTLLGFFAVSVSNAILPFALAFAGGTMLYVISDEMIPETHAHGSQRGATYALLVGFCVMLISDVLLG